MSELLQGRTPVFLPFELHKRRRPMPSLYAILHWFNWPCLMCNLFMREVKFFLIFSFWSKTKKISSNSFSSHPFFREIQMSTGFFWNFFYFFLRFGQRQPERVGSNGETAFVKESKTQYSYVTTVLRQIDPEKKHWPNGITILKKPTARPMVPWKFVVSDDKHCCIF